MAQIYSAYAYYGWPLILLLGARTSVCTPQNQNKLRFFLTKYLISGAAWFSLSMPIMDDPLSCHWVPEHLFAPHLGKRVWDSRYINQIVRPHGFKEPSIWFKKACGSEFEMIQIFERFSQNKNVQSVSVHCCYLRASVGIGMAILPLEGIYPQIKRAKVLFKTKTNNLPLICNSIFQTRRQWL